jgi:hypothetical protein
MERVRKIITKDLLNKLRYLSLVAGIALVALVILNNVDNGNKQKLEAAGGDDQPYSIYIVAGQSNAEGSNSFLAQMPSGQELGTHPVDDDADPNDNAQIWWDGADGVGIEDEPNGFVQLLQSGGTYVAAGWINSSNTADPSKEGLINFKDLDQPPPMGQMKGQFGSEIGLARELYNQGKRKIIFLKVTYGFQALANTTTPPNIGTPFVPYDWHPDSPGQRSYYHLKENYALLTDYLNDNNMKYTVDGFFWLQGETDTLDTDWTNQYEANFDYLVNRVKEDMHLHPSAHFVARKFNLRNCTDNAYPAVGNYCGAAYALDIDGATPLNILSSLTVNALISIPLNNERIRTVRDGMQRVSDKYDWVDMLETDDDQPFYNDHIHLNATAQLKTGERMAKMYKQPFYHTGADQCVSPSSLNLKVDDYDCDGVVNTQEDLGRGTNPTTSQTCPFTINGVNQTLNYTQNNGNLGDDDTDCDGFPDYIDNKNNQIGSGLTDV